MHAPHFFYKFLNTDRIDVLRNGLIRFAPIGSFNDPFELEPSFTHISRDYARFVLESSDAVSSQEFSKEDIAYSNARMDLLDNYKDKYRKNIGQYGVLSLSSNLKITPFLGIDDSKEDPRHNILMWSHYADSHKGFAVEFKPTFIKDIEIIKVEYSMERHLLTFEDIDELNFEKIFFRKSREWEYEQEYRAVLPLSDADNVEHEQFHLFRFDKSAVNSVTLGCAMNPETKEAIKEIIQSSPEYSNVAIHHAILDEAEYKLDFWSDYGGWTNNHADLPIINRLQKKT